MPEVLVDTTETAVPSMLSAEFHLRFFPALLISRFGKNAMSGKTTFVSASAMQGVLVLFFAGAAAFVGSALHPHLGGWLLFGVAAAGLAYVLVVSIHEMRGVAPTFEAFLFPLFFFCLAFGLAAGALTGLGQPAFMRLGHGCAGIALGYWAGLLAGLHGQRLGFVAILLYPIAIAGAAGCLVTAMVLLST